MLRTVSPNISIITNFGCRANCWYCIWKKHPLKDIQLKTDWENLESFLFQNRDKGKVSVSGGGDCLYRYDKHIGWWIKLFAITEHLDMKVDVHTREQFTHQRFWAKHINKCVFSSDDINKDEEYLVYLSHLTKVRIVHVVTAQTTLELAEDFIRFSDANNCQLTFKQLTGFEDNGMYRQIKDLYPDVFCLDEGDYNIYYMPDNTITNMFL